MSGQQPSMDTMTGPFLAPVPGPWLLLTATEQSAFARRLDAHLRATGLPEPSFSRQCPLLRTHAVPLSFYPGWLLLSAEVQLPRQELANIDVLMGPGFFWCIDGTSTMIHDLHGGAVPLPAAEPGGEIRRLPSPLLPMTPRVTGPDYLRFFCHAVRGDEGSFRIVSSAQELRDCGVTRDVERLAALLRPLRVVWRRGKPRQDEAGEPPRRTMRAQATLLYGGAIFDADFELDLRGMVTMVGDRSIASDVAPAERTRQWLRTIRPANADPAAPGRTS